LEDELQVLIVPKWYPTADHPAFGAFCRDHALALARSGVEVTVLASYATRKPPFLIYDLACSEEDGFPTYRLRYRRPLLRPLALVCQLIGMAAALRRIVRAGRRPQIVHAHVYSAALPAWLVAVACRAPLVVSEHYTGFARGLVEGSERLIAAFALRRARLIAPVSRELAGRLAELAPRTPIEVVPNPVDCSLFAPPPSGSREAGRILCVAALAAKKGHRYLFSALGLLAPELRSQLCLVVIGDGEERDRLERLAAGTALGGGIHFQGEVGREVVAAEMRKASLLVLPSLYENLPCVLLEAAASGLRFVATAVGGVPELFELEPLNRCCRLVPPGDPQALAEAIAGLLEKPSGCGAALAETARRRFAYEAVATRWLELYAAIR
jgi:glycosyltransferase involved in cell wall biosynthesis